jgi:hypothetical protein
MKDVVCHKLQCIPCSQCAKATKEVVDLPESAATREKWRLASATDLQEAPVRCGSPSPTARRCCRTRLVALASNPRHRQPLCLAGTQHGSVAKNFLHP